ncbi:MAG: hypothetical protein AB8B48_07990 [Pseudomonadales bacterium]
MIDYLSKSFPDAVEWLSTSVAFPCSMVDRIVPAMTDARRQQQASLLGLEDAAAVQTECFSQWIIEDHFAAERPAWEQAGVEFVQNILPYENIKLRLLNASHTAIAVCGLLLKLETVADVMNDANLAGFIEKLMNEELIPALDLPEGFDIDHYRDQLLRRFRNPHLHHRCAQIAMDSSEKISQRWLATLQSETHTLLTKALSGWCYLILHTDIEIDDPRGQQLLKIRESSEAVTARVREILACVRIRNGTIEDMDRLVSQIEQNIGVVLTQGLRALLS